MPRSDIRLTPVQMEIVQTLAQSNMRIFVTAQRLYRSHSSVTYHMEQIRKKTGLSPWNFFDLHKLLDAEVEEGKHA